jgi:DNA-binding MarR family transcriptional regulator
MHVASEEYNNDLTYKFSLCSNHFKPLARKVLLSNGLTDEYFDQMMSLLICLNKNGPLILKDLVEETALPYPTLSNLIDRGEAINVIERIKSLNDGRARTIQLTEHCELEIMPKILRAKDQTNDVLTSNLSNVEKDDFITLLGKITDSLKTSTQF